LTSIIPLLIAPLLIWSWKKNQNFKIDKQGRDVLNFQITMMLLLFLCGFLLMPGPAVFTLLGRAQVDMGRLGLFEIMILCAPMPMIFIGLFCTYQGMANATRALAKKHIHYSLSIPIVK
jgi:uncharacterized Tic20 family protein